MLSSDSVCQCGLEISSLQFTPLQSEAVEANLELAPADYQTLLDEVAQAQELDRDRIDRIHQLEQALDQALVWLEDLKSQVHDQQILESQLATTEDFSSVQQQVIARLKLQLVEQQQLLEAQILETQQRDQAVQELLATIETLTQAQQRELERLRSRITHDQVEVQSDRSRIGKHLHDLQAALAFRQQRVSELEGETLATRTRTTHLKGQLEAAQQQVRELSISLCQQRTSPTDREVQFKSIQHPLSAPRTVSSSHATSAESEPANPIQQDMARAQRQIKDLETQLTQQRTHYMRWQQSYQELGEERDRLQSRVTTLEQQTAEMQEQILQQAQQATEYETAVQYWKDRFNMNQRQMTHLKERVEQLLAQPSSPNDEANPHLTELLAMLRSIPEAEAELPVAAIPLPRLGTVELPEFLVRRRLGGKG